MYFTSPLVRSLLLTNSFSRMRLISCGIKMFAKQDSANHKDSGLYPCKWRILSEGLDVLRPYMGAKRIIQAKLSTLKALMMTLNTVYGGFEDKEFVARLDGMESGSCVVEVEATGEGVM